MMNWRRFIEKKKDENAKIRHFWSKIAYWYRYQKVVPVLKSGTGTHDAVGSGTGTTQTGTGTYW